MKASQHLGAWMFGLSVTVLLWVGVAEGAAVAAQFADTAPSASPLGVYLTTGVGDSMEPTMGSGDRALCLEQIEPEMGDVVTVDRTAFGHSHDVRHRIVEMNETHVVTMGDGNDYRDGPVPREAVRCTTVWAEGAGWNP